MVRIDVTYEGDLHCSLTHEPSGMIISTDAPKDNHGKGEAFSPTDLCAASLGACMATVMGIEARKRRVPLEGLQVSVVKEMTNVPVRRIAALDCTLRFAAPVAESDKTILEHIAHTCPVKQSLSGDIDIRLTFIYPDGQSV